jgi:hypothetical protein
MQRILVPVSAGELVDKITILEIKASHSLATPKYANISSELAALETVLNPLLAAVPGLPDLKRALHDVNQTLWTIEDDIRRCERDKEFGARFIAFARAVYRTNDRRAALKRQIDEAAGSEIVEEKIYEKYE